MPCSRRVPSERKPRRFIRGICATNEAWASWLRAGSINHLLQRLDRGVRFHSIDLSNAWLVPLHIATTQERSLAALPFLPQVRFQSGFQPSLTLAKRT